MIIMTINELSDEQMEYLKKLVPMGKHRRNNGKTTIYDWWLFKVFAEYCKYKGLITGHSFRCKHFNIETKLSTWHPPYADIPLTPGQIRMAIRYGHKHDLLGHTDTNRRRWYFTDKAIIMINKGEI